MQVSIDVQFYWTGFVFTFHTTHLLNPKLEARVGLSNPPAQPAYTRPAFTRSDYSGGWPRVPSFKTRLWWVGFESPRSKPVKPDPPKDIIFGEFSNDSNEFSA